MRRTLPVLKAFFWRWKYRACNYQSSPARRACFLAALGRGILATHLVTQSQNENRDAELSIDPIDRLRFLLVHCFAHSNAGLRLIRRNRRRRLQFRQR